MCFDELDTVESMRGHTMLCFMCPTVTGVGFWIQLDNENTSVCDS